MPPSAQQLCDARICIFTLLRFCTGTQLDIAWCICAHKAVAHGFVSSSLRFLQHRISKPVHYCQSKYARIAEFMLDSVSFPIRSLPLSLVHHSKSLDQLGAVLTQGLSEYRRLCWVQSASVCISAGSRGTGSPSSRSPLLGSPVCKHRLCRLHVPTTSYWI